MIRCWPIIKSLVRRVLSHHQHIHPKGRHHHLHHLVTSKMAIVGYTCIVIGGGAWMANGPWLATPYETPPSEEGASSSPAEALSFLPTSEEEGMLSLPSEILQLDTPLPPTSQAEREAMTTTETKPVSEPSSFWLLLVPLIVAILWRTYLGTNQNMPPKGSRRVR